MISAYWCSNDNFGDALTPYLITKITGHKPKHIKLEDSNHKFLITGSILGTKNAKYATIWGCGLSRQDEIVYKAHDIKAVRGPISYNKAIKTNNYDMAIGDPGILLPRFYNPSINKKHKIGIIPSWIDHKLVCKKYPDNYIINIFDKIENVIDNILSCEMTICSCLHGLIASVAYEVPTKWVEFSNNVVGDGTKFHDFLQSIKNDYEPINLKGKPVQIKNLPFYHEVKNLNSDKLMDYCPLNLKR